MIVSVGKILYNMWRKVIGVVCLEIRKSKYLPIETFLLS